MNWNHSRYVSVCKAEVVIKTVRIKRWHRPNKRSNQHVGNVIVVLRYRQWNWKRVMTRFTSLFYSISNEESINFKFTVQLHLQSLKLTLKLRLLLNEKLLPPTIFGKLFQFSGTFLRKLHSSSANTFDPSRTNLPWGQTPWKPMILSIDVFNMWVTILEISPLVSE